ncbi:hypothetical protein ACI3L1_18210 [Deinococcus sp. SM5_A1]|uniref:hypothetical protein n=1 Tax=Deinococcus sp. SM5_A1 TaxID=3379094 RepID=UPI00385C398E
MAISRVRPALSNLTSDVRTLVNFTVPAITIPTGSRGTAQGVAPVTFGLVAAGQDSEYVSGERSTVIVDLKKGAQGWAMTRWDLEKRGGEPYAE